MIKKFILSTALCAGVSSAALAQDSEVRIGVLFGFTGPIASMAPVIAETAELALREASKSDAFLNGTKIVPVRADSTCINRNAAVAAAERLLKEENAVAFVGAGCSGAASAVLANVARPHGVFSISPTATSPGLTDIQDDGLFFRTAPSDARQGEVLAELLVEKNIRKVALTYTDNDYGTGLTKAFTKAFEDRDGKVMIARAHIDGKQDYAAEVAALGASGADILMIAGYADQGGRAILKTSLETAAFDRFVLPDGMVSESLIEEFGTALAGSIGTLPGSDNDHATEFEQILLKSGITEQAPFRAEAYDAAAVLALAMQAAGSTDGEAIAEMMPHVANAPGIEIGPGEIAKGMFILSQGGAIDYVGASDVEFTPDGDAHGTYREVSFSENGLETVRFW